MRRWLVGASDAEMRGVGTRGVGIAERSEVKEAADGAAVAVTRGDRLEIDLTFDVARSTAHRFGIDVRASSNRRERTRLLYDGRARRFRFDRSRSGIVGGIREVSLSAERLRLHLFIDRSSVELFVNDGERSFTARVYPDPGSDGVLIFAEGGAVVVESMRVWRLKNIWAGCFTDRGAAPGIPKWPYRL